MSSDKVDATGYHFCTLQIFAQRQVQQPLSDEEWCTYHTLCLWLQARATLDRLLIEVQSAGLQKILAEQRREDDADGQEPVI